MQKRMCSILHGNSGKLKSVILCRGGQCLLQSLLQCWYDQCHSVQRGLVFTLVLVWLISVCVVWAEGLLQCWYGQCHSVQRGLVFTLVLVWLISVCVVWAEGLLQCWYGQCQPVQCGWSVYSSVGMVIVVAYYKANTNCRYTCMYIKIMSSCEVVVWVIN